MVIKKPLNSFTLLLLFLSYISMHILYLFMHIKLKWTFILVSVNDKALYTSQVLIMQLQRLLALKAGCCTAGQLEVRGILVHQQSVLQQQNSKNILRYSSEKHRTLSRARKMFMVVKNNTQNFCSFSLLNSIQTGKELTHYFLKFL